MRKYNNLTPKKIRALDVQFQIDMQRLAELQHQLVFFQTKKLQEESQANILRAKIAEEEALLLLKRRVVYLTKNNV